MLKSFNFYQKLSSNINRHSCARYYSSKKWIIDKSRFPTLCEKDLEEKFMRGSGPGGQAVAKTNNACFLRHIPTGINVKNHATRSLEQNRKKARQSLVEKLDAIYNGENSVAAQKKRILSEKSSRNESKSKKRLERKKQWKENEEG